MYQFDFSLSFLVDLTVTLKRSGMPLHFNRFAIDLAIALTAQSSHRYDWVARRGRFSIYSLIVDLAPAVSDPFLTEADATYPNQSFE